jgi:hypothetical protein
MLVLYKEKSTLCPESHHILWDPRPSWHQTLRNQIKVELQSNEPFLQIEPGQIRAQTLVSIAF